ncbi:MAG: hypothetical protein KIT14_11445 [bacterium]|nr:hypothetical protein [bacterium]
MSAPPVARRGSSWLAVLVLLVAVPAAGPALGCDAHSVYVEPDRIPQRRRLTLGVAEQFTHMGTVMIDGHEVPSEGERLNSSITQVFATYGFTDWIGVQLNLPIVARDYRRLENGRLTSGSVSGFGDLTLVAIGTPFDAELPVGRLTASLIGGLKLPTGDASLLAEELGALRGVARRRDARDGGVTHHGPGPGHPAPSPGGRRTVSAIRGHDLAIGSGSVDGVVGGQLGWRRGRAFAFGFLQYAVRSEGAYAYTFANELSWSGGPGYDVLTGDTWSLGVQAVLSGDTKGNDTQAGIKLDDTARTRLYVGPAILFDWTDRLAAEVGVDVPVVRDETSLQMVPDVRVRAGLSWRF